MKTEIFILLEQQTVLGVYTDRDVCNKVLKAYRLTGHNVKVQHDFISDNVPGWCERLLALNEEK